MDGDYSIYLDYKEIRRRVERRLKQGGGLLAHVLLYLLAVPTVVLSEAYLSYTYFSFGGARFYEVYVNPSIGIPFVIWSLVLLTHAFRVYRRSGASGEAREQAVEAELRERLVADDTALLADSRRAFRVHSLLVEDIQSRSGMVNSLLLVSAINALVWVMWALAGANTPYAWLGAVLAGPVVLLPLLALNRHARRRQEKMLIRTLADWNVPPYIKRKRQMRQYAEAYAGRLTDDEEDGELVDWEDKDNKDSTRSAQF
ncbi:MAG: hypothetical protein DWB42_06105 [Chloroflexi bacterium]|nr:hypothetical protein [Chloroflexota bacterium]MDL1884401.1 hypothetical protein [Anaerolineae bacterium CFX8]